MKTLLLLNPISRLLDGQPQTKHKAQKSYDLKKRENSFILIGMKTYVDINKIESKKYEDVFYLIQRNASRQWDIFYAGNYSIDPFRFQVCQEK